MSEHNSLPTEDEAALRPEAPSPKMVPRPKSMEEFFALMEGEDTTQAFPQESDIHTDTGEPPTVSAAEASSTLTEEPEPAETGVHTGSPSRASDSVPDETVESPEEDPAKKQLRELRESLASKSKQLAQLYANSQPGQNNEEATDIQEEAASLMQSIKDLNGQDLGVLQQKFAEEVRAQRIELGDSTLPQKKEQIEKNPFAEMTPLERNQALRDYIEETVQVYTDKDVYGLAELGLETAELLATIVEKDGIDLSFEDMVHTYDQAIEAILIKRGVVKRPSEGMTDKEKKITAELEELERHKALAEIELLMLQTEITETYVANRHANLDASWDLVKKIVGNQNAFNSEGDYRFKLNNFTDKVFARVNARNKAIADQKAETEVQRPDPAANDKLSGAAEVAKKYLFGDDHPDNVAERQKISKKTARNIGVLALVGLVSPLAPVSWLAFGGAAASSYRGYRKLGKVGRGHGHVSRTTPYGPRDKKERQHGKGSKSITKSIDDVRHENQQQLRRLADKGIGLV